MTAALAPQTANAQRRAAGGEDGAGDPLARVVDSLRFRSIGPAVVSGRISALAVHPTDKFTWYVATASGGLWKTTNAGTTFSPIFDDQASYSIGTVVLDPNNPNVVWVGSGENNAQRSVSYGDGVYKSVDGGRSWRNVGLPESEHIAKILIDPRNSDVVYVASQGPVFNGGGERGLYKTTDGGETWTKILEAGEWAGVTDAVMDPRNPDILIAATWQRARRQFGSIGGGPASGLHRSTDGGATWTRVPRGRRSGLPRDADARIGLAISPVDPDVVYAIVEGEGGGFYRSTDNGVSWRRRSSRTTSGNYYQEIMTDPVDVDRVYVMDTRYWVTEDGGENFELVGNRNKHVDNHALWIDPDDTDHMLVGTDGGLYETFDRGRTYDWFQNLPLGQFYRVEVDSLRPFYRVWGGTQDNSTLGGPYRTRTRRGARNADWVLTQGGDGFVTRVDPFDQNIVYSESQHAGLARFNLATGEEVSIRPEGPLGEALVWHWDTPLIISPHSPSRLYVAANRVFRSEDRGSSWTLVSPDLTKQIDRNRLEMMGRVWGVDTWRKNASTSVWGAIVSFAESPLREGLLFAGTDDGNIQISEDGGANWRAVGSIRGVPDTTFVTDIQPSWHDPNTVYVAFDNHKAGDYRPYIARLRNGLPTIQVRDMVFQTQHDDLVLGTFGRGFYVLDDLEVLRALTPELLASDGGLLPINRTPMYAVSSPDPNWQGERFYTADNPEVGATVRYYLKDAIRTQQSERERADAAAAERGEDVFYPSWDDLREEDLEEDPQVVLTITDAEGRVVRRLMGRTRAGLNSVHWDLRYPSVRPITGGGGGGFFFGGGSAGPYVVPGTYTVSAVTWVNGGTTPLGSPQSFEVYHLDGLERTPEMLAFQQQTAELQRAMMGASSAASEAQTRLDRLEQALERTPGADAQLHADLRDLRAAVRDVQWEMSGDPTVGRRREATPTSLTQRLGRITGGAWSNAPSEVTGMHRELYAQIAGEFAGILERLRPLLETELARLEDAAEAAGAPWTSGRLPQWRR
jgi:photosystem II stability/assembly factor-like uncharacterized protein